MLIRFFVPGRPSPQGSKAFKGVRGGRGILIESSKEVGPWRERVALAAHGAMNHTAPQSGAISVVMQFVLPRPKSAPKTKPVLATKRPDIDKLVRAVLDALTNVCFRDDSQVTTIHAVKRVARADEPSGVDIEITTHGA